jgi:competence protein ComEC
MAAPLFPIALSFCAGILLARLIHCPIPYLLSVCLFLVLICWFLFYANRLFLLNLVLLLAFIFLGVAWPPIYHASYSPNHLRTLVRLGKIDLSQPCRVTGVCRKSTVEADIGEQIELDVEAIESRYSVFQIQGRIRLALFYQKERAQYSVSVGTSSAPKPSIKASGARLPARTEPIRSSRLINPGDRIEVLTNLRQPRNFNDPGQFDYAAYLERQEVILVGIVKNELLVTRKSAHQSGRFTTLIQSLRATFDNALNQPRFFSDDVRAALKALLLGEKQDLSPKVERAFQASGIYHVLVVSGQHVAILAGVLLGIFTFLRFPRSISVLLAMSALLLYCLIIEGQPSVVRATVMTCCFLMVLTFDRDRSLLNSLSISALLILLVDPSWLFDAGFQLSFLAVLAIGLIGLPILRRTTQPYRNALWRLEEPSLDGRFPPRLADFRLAWRIRIESLQRRLALKSARLVTWIVLAPLYCLLSVAEVLLTSLSIQTLFFLLMIIYFHRISLISIFLNVLVIPLVSLIIPIGFLFLGLSAVAPWSSGPAGLLCGWLTGWLLILAEHFAGSAWGNYRMPTPPSWLALAYLVGLFLWSIPSVSKPIRLGAGGLALLTASLLLVQPFQPPIVADQLKGTFLDVRQGDSILLQFPDGANMLIDGGGLLARSFGEDFSEATFDVGEQVVSPFLWSQGLKELDVVVLTHAHHDHLGGLEAVLSNFRVRELWLGENPLTPEYVHLLKHAIREQIVLKHFGTDDVSHFHGAEITFINPDKTLNLAHQPSNNDSLAFHLRFGSRTLLLTGDIERKIEARLLNRSLPLQADVLKVAHHGSRSSTTEEFLRRVNPILAVISVAEHSPFGHPHQEVLERLAAHSIPVFRTDRDGAVSIWTDGRKIRVEPFLEPAQDD